ncbi:MAG: enoyl-CoA hydratase [Pseudomonadales bacterium]|nr:enoyl-CoA hydratase [Pseudomonadales bacterium]
MGNEDLVLVSRDDGVTTVTLNRPKALNALSMALRNRISEVFDEIASDGSTEVVILTAAGRAFTVGLDLKELGGEIDPSAKASSRDISAAIGALQIPIIGAVNGFAITGGFELALMCDVLIATPDAKFADTHARVGVVPGWGLSQRLPRLIGINRAKELSLTGNYLDAETADQWGLVNRVIPADELLPTCQKLARDILSTEPVTRGEIRRIMDAGWHSTLAQGLDTEYEASQTHSRAQRPSEQVASRRAAIQDRGRAQTNED